MPETRLRNVLVTGASGFVGTVLCTRLVERGYRITRALRSAAQPRADSTIACTDIVVGDIAAEAPWERALREVDAVVHLAARTHVMHETADDPLALYRLTNVDGTRRLAQSAVRAGVQRFIFLSSVKVNCETTQGTPLNEAHLPKPDDAYGVSKLEAEHTVCESASGTQMQYVILRPPLLYGPGVKGNFLRLMRAVDRGIPLPLASIANRRSLLNVDNLVDAIIVSLEHPAAGGQLYLLADDLGVSTPSLVRAIAQPMARHARLLPCPVSLLKMAGRITGRAAAVSRLVDSLQIDNAKLRHELGWEPRLSLAAGLEQTARWYYRHPAHGGSA